jgi:ribonuclease HI
MEHKNFYAVGKGVVTGIYYDWESCKKNVINYTGAKYKKFDNEKDALLFIEKHSGNIANNIKEVVKQSVSNITTTEIDESAIYIFTDGSCSSNGRYNACAGIGIYFGEDDKRNISRRIEGKQTNNTAELIAIIEAIKIIPENETKQIIICTDSEYAIKCANSYGKKLESNEWKSTTGKEPSNVELVKELYILTQKRKVIYNHIMAHTENTDFFSNGNRQADLLANKSVEHYDTDEKREIIQKIYLNVLYKDKDTAKSLGAKWCSENKLWYYTSNLSEEKKSKLLELYKTI